MTDKPSIVNPREIKTFIDKRMAPKLVPLGLTPSTGLFIFIASKKEGASLKELSEIMNVDKSLCTRNAKWLIEKGFIVDKADEGTKYAIHLTDKGHKVANDVAKYHEEIWKELFKYTTEEERRTFVEITHKIKRVIDESGNE